MKNPHSREPLGSRLWETLRFTQGDMFRREAHMAIEITVPELGESVLEATVSRWLKKEGDFVNAGDVLLELETDKVNLEVGAKGSGILQKIQAPEGADVKVGNVLGIIDEKATEPKQDTPKAEQAAPQSSQPEPV